MPAEEKECPALGDEGSSGEWMRGHTACPEYLLGLCKDTNGGPSALCAAGAPGFWISGLGAKWEVG